MMEGQKMPISQEMTDFGLVRAKGGLDSSHAPFPALEPPHWGRCETLSGIDLGPPVWD